ncbi:ketoreductase [Sporothrix schenckii 1099-18]|uniref:Ketoreductase n=1 Tax=Sporothrix schenckii 1099-18 TaxID=1397361 RepID=A0A0F2MDD9_SPOSC|nr:ketoreductase [Sporothrix schenckii 1099-18]KJR87703.1 ketoreductase [Sporothrix schenckii 1099-18]
MTNKGNVLLTGGSGFIASHVLDILLDHGYAVMITVRTAGKGKAVLASLPDARRHLVSFSLVDDVAKEGAFDNVLQSSLFDFVIHTASPYQLRVEDPVRDLLDPALRGTTGLLRSVQTLAPSVRRVVLTSSSAAMLNPAHHAAVYDESCWRPMTWAEAQLPHNAYEASKVFAERAAWALVNGSDDVETATETKTTGGGGSRATSFDLAVINCTYTFGPVQRWLASWDAVNASNQRIRDCVLGQWKTAHGNGAAQVPPTRPVFTWVDVRDVALAHVRAIQVPSAGGQRFYVVGGHFSNGQLANIVREGWMQGGGEKAAMAAARLPSAEETPDDLPADVYQFDNRRSRDVLGLRECRSLTESVLGTADSLLALGARCGDGK